MKAPIAPLLVGLAGCTASAPSMRLDLLADSIVAGRSYSCDAPHLRDLRDPWELRLAGVCTLGYNPMPTARDTLVIISRDSADHVLRLTRVWISSAERSAEFAQLHSTLTRSLGPPIPCDSLPVMIHWRDRELLVAIDSGMPDSAIRWSVARALKESLC